MNANGAWLARALGLKDPRDLGDAKLWCHHTTTHNKPHNTKDDKQNHEAQLVV